jgi:hypothetical protein
MYAINNEENILDIALLYPKEGSSKEAEDYKVVRVKIGLDQMKVVDKIELHKRT